MTTALTSPSAPAPLPPKEARSLAAVVNEAHFGQLSYPIDRRRLERRAAEHDLWLAPARDSEIMMILYSLQGMPAQAAEDERDAAFSVRRDVGDLAGVPAFALERAAAAFRRGMIGDGKWRPTAGELRRAAEGFAHPFRQALADLRKALAAPVARRESDAERRRAVVAEAKARLDPLFETTHDEPRPAGQPRDLLAEEGVPRLSEEALRLCTGSRRDPA